MPDGFWSVEWEHSARELFQRVKQEASALGDDYIGTPHLLLAAVACSPLETGSVLTLDAVRAAIMAMREPREAGTITLTPWSQTPRFKLAIERAMRRAFAKSRAVSCVDIWNGLLDDSESECLRALHYLGVDVEKVRANSRE